MNAIDLLKKDHQEVQKFFAEYQEADENDFEKRESLFARIEMELTLHTDAEEHVFYPRFREKLSSDEADDMVNHALEEHTQVKEILAEMIELDPDEEVFEDKMMSLIEMVQDHVREEEEKGGMFDRARQVFSEAELERIARQMEQQKEQSREDLAA